MLILSRKANQALHIDGEFEIRGRTVRLGLCAPDEVDILRAALVELEPPGAPTPDQSLRRCGQ